MNIILHIQNIKMEKLKRLNFYICFILIFCNSSIILSQNPTWKVWNSNNSNLPPQTTIFSLNLDSNGIVWAGSNKGLLKFNGNNFTIYDTINSPMKSNLVVSITKDFSENIWMATIGNNASIMKFDGVNIWNYYNQYNTNIYSGTQLCITTDKTNNIWAHFRKLLKYDGNSWQTFDSTNSPFKDGTGWEIFVDKYNNKWISKDFQGIFKYTENNNTWINYTTQNSGLPLGYVRKIREDSFGNLWISVWSSGLTKYNLDNNTWQTWTPFNSNLPYAYLSGLYIDKMNTKWIGFHTNEFGLVEFNDTTFKTYNTPLGGSSIYDIKEDKYGNLWLGTSRGLMQFNKTGIVSIKNENSSKIENFEITRIYPNPFNPMTKIEFMINKTSNIQLKVFDIKGKLVKEFMNKRFISGNYTTELDMSNYSSGVYFVIFYLDNKLITTKKMILIK